MAPAALLIRGAGSHGFLSDRCQAVVPVGFWMTLTLWFRFHIFPTCEPGSTGQWALAGIACACATVSGVARRSQASPQALTRHDGTGINCYRLLLLIGTPSPLNIVVTFSAMVPQVISPLMKVILWLGLIAISNSLGILPNIIIVQHYLCNVLWIMRTVYHVVH